MAYTSNMTRARRHVLPLLALCVSVPLGATTVYRSVDDDGVVSFSDVKPDSGPADTLHIDTPPAQPDDAQRQHLEEMRATTDRMVADRRAREKHRAEMRQLQTANEPPPTPQYEPDPPYFGGYWGGHRRWHPGHRTHPVHPVRPPLRPAKARSLPSHNDYPASLIRRHYEPRTRALFGTPRD